MTQVCQFKLSESHFDPKKLSSRFSDYFHDPDEFIPERFDPDHGGVKAFKDRGVLIPFGDGPRICLGMRFALLQLKAAAYEIVRNFNITVDPRMLPHRPLEIDPEELLMNAKKGGLWINFEAL
jgi:cytochrome P450 family 28